MTPTDLFGFLNWLDDRRMAYKIDHVRDAIMVTVAVPGALWEVEFFRDGSVEVEVYRSTEDLRGTEALDDLAEWVD